jgi:hypothetical protein
MKTISRLLIYIGLYLFLVLTTMFIPKIYNNMIQYKVLGTIYIIVLIILGINILILCIMHPHCNYTCEVIKK